MLRFVAFAWLILLYTGQLSISAQPVDRKAAAQALAQSLNDVLKQISAYIDQNRFEEAERLLISEMAKWRKIQPPDNPAVSMFFLGFGRLMTKQRRYDEAEHFYQQAVATCDRFIPKKMQMVELAHLAKAQALGELANIYEARSELEKAVAFRKKSLDELQRLENLKKN